MCGQSVTGTDTVKEREWAEEYTQMLSTRGVTSIRVRGKMTAISDVRDVGSSPTWIETFDHEMDRA